MLLKENTILFLFKNSAYLRCDVCKLMSFSGHALEFWYPYFNFQGLLNLRGRAARYEAGKESKDDIVKDFVKDFVSSSKGFIENLLRVLTRDDAWIDLL